jgi:hypothetical protein
MNIASAVKERPAQDRDGHAADHDAIALDSDTESAGTARLTPSGECRRR